MPNLNDLYPTPVGARRVLQGNTAFALGALHAGIHAANGYPGTPSTEAMEAMLEAPDRILAGWSVNEAVAVGVAMGHAIAGRDAIATMKVPGLFQAADVVASAASSSAFTGALVLFVATDHAPSSTQYLVDSRHFLSSLRIPVVEPRDHQDLYRAPRIAADMSRRFRTPVAILCSSVLCHAEGVVAIEETRTVAPSPSAAAQGHVLLPQDALRAFRHGVVRRIPDIAQWAESSPLVDELPGIGEFGIVATGEAALVVRETLALRKLRAPLLSLGIVHPLPLERIRTFVSKFKNVYLFEDGERFVEGALAQAGIALQGKEKDPTLTNWTPDEVGAALDGTLGRPPETPISHPGVRAPKRPPSICPGCPYKAASLAIQSLKRQGKVELVFGDIGCSTLLHFQGALDLNLCMGASESMRQGFVLSEPAMAARCISLIGDSSECHSGMDATRNAVFRRIPGVKVVLDNRAIAMTGAQASPTSRTTESGKAPFDLVASLDAEGARSERVDAYDRQAVEHAIEAALRDAETGSFRTVVLEGACIEVADRTAKKGTTLSVDEDLCLLCGACDVCPGIDTAPGETPVFNGLCTRCGEGAELCVAACPVQAISVARHDAKSASRPTSGPIAPASDSNSETSEPLPPAVRVAVCGVGGQGNLFLGKVLAQVVQSSRDFDRNIVKGEVHGMAQKGGTVCSTFACGDVHSPVFATGSVDILVVMERSEVLRPEFLGLLKPDGAIVLNDQAILPLGCAIEQYPGMDSIRESTRGFRTISLKASEFAPRNANAAMLGALSTLDPFDRIPVDAWEDALTRLSPLESIAQGNLFAFHMGRQKSSPIREPSEQGTSIAREAP
ncbi:MAG TPA: 2-oxoacid:acceptor oxidoreductase family protein [Fibrobacteria bacterium]|nr:2-oxoacid:acceptor oxidoreductase family protein [Fibrobacteria bacterium]